MPDVVDTVECVPDNGWRYHPKHVEQFTDTNKVCKVAPGCIFIGIERINIFLTAFCYLDALN